MFEHHFFPERRNEILGLTVVPTIKKSDSDSLRDFAEETRLKNELEAILPDRENICHLRDFAAETLAKNGTVAD